MSSEQNTVKTTKGVVLFLLLFIIVGIGTLAFGVVTNSSDNAKKEYFTKVESVVVDYDVFNSGDSDSSTTYAPIYEYKLDGETYRWQSASSSSSRPKIGSDHTLYVNPDDPDDVINTGITAGFVAIYMGILFIILPATFLVLSLLKGEKLVFIAKNFAIGFCLLVASVPLWFVPVPMVVKLFVSIFGAFGIKMIYDGVVHGIIKQDYDTYVRKAMKSYKSFDSDAPTISESIGQYVDEDKVENIKEKCSIVYDKAQFISKMISAVVAIVIGLVFVLVTVLVVALPLLSQTNSSSHLAVRMLLFLAIFLGAGLFSIVKGIMTIRKLIINKRDSEAM